jgi:thioredoxin reductase (NADPH)
MAVVIVIGGGPAGYSAALFAAKAGLETVLFDTNETRMHSAYLYNYLGIEEILGTDFMKIARKQVERFQCNVREEKVVKLERTAGKLTIETASGHREEATYVVICTGLNEDLLKQLGVAYEGDIVNVDRHGQTTVENVYAAGWVTRSKSQAIISAGDGAAAAIHLIAKERGKPYSDFDVPPASKQK